MKSMIRLVLFCGILAAVFPAISSVPLRWTVETSRLQPVVFDALHGETLEIEASFNSYGKPLEIKGEAALFYQTNGMGSAWWQIPATVTSNRIEAVFPPSADPGAARLSCFLGGPASTYRAAFSLRFANSPGATPNALPLPVAKLDLAAVEVLNAPWLTAETDPTVPDWAKQPNAPATMTTNAVKDIVTKTEYGFTDWECTPKTFRGQVLDVVWEDYGDGDGGWYINIGSTANAFTNSKDALSLYWDAGWDGSEEGLVFRATRRRSNTPQNALGLALRDEVKQTKNEVMSEITKKADASTVNDLSNTVTQWTTYWDGDDVRDTVTNYYGSLGMPARYLEQKMPPDETHDAPWFKVVWSELTRWNAFMTPYHQFTNAVNAELAQKADRAWGFYDSGTGEYSPDGFLQISTPNIIIAKDLAYQKTITTGGCSMWVLTATHPFQLTGETEQGYFRITDGDGNALFEIVKGDKRIAGATATALTMDSGSMVITYPVSGDHPTLSVCTDLKAADWQTGEDITVATVAWSGGSGNWVATVTPVGPRPSLFCKASYEVGGNTYIKNNVATSIDKVVVGGHEYEVTVETINGKKLLVLQ